MTGRLMRRSSAQATAARVWRWRAMNLMYGDIDPIDGIGDR
jgi:hypothetical protein